MYKYSPIKTVYVKNFRNIGEVELDFTDSPIISLIGENEAGKTSLVKAFAVCAAHAVPREQKEFIRDGTHGFGIAIELENGTLITRIKTQTLNKYSVKFETGDEWDTNKIDAGLPVQVKEVMGIIEEPETKEFLHIRTYEDQLLFVVTPASTNYKVMYDALKVDQLTRAIKVGSKEANDLKSTIAYNESSIRTLTDNLRGLRLYNLEPLINVRKRIQEQLNSLNRLEKAKEILDRINNAKKQLGDLSLIESNDLKEINVLEVTKLNSAYRILDSVDKLNKLLDINKKIEAANEIDINMVTRLANAIAKKNELSRKVISAGALVNVADLVEINEYEIQQLNRANKLRVKLANDIKLYNILDNKHINLVEQRDFDTVYKISKIKALIARNELLNSEVNKIDTYIAQVDNYLKACGVEVANCPKCGESLILEDGKHIHA